jgi:hypothetical protein
MSLGAIGLPCRLGSAPAGMLSVDLGRSDATAQMTSRDLVLAMPAITARLAAVRNAASLRA